jgi:4-amino-4-deoxy-L-arabinose transferase-like glycosyltransferase
MVVNPVIGNANKFLLIIFAIGLFTHVESFVSQERLLHSVAEDAYLMLTVARNLALGQGLSTADGSILTNGVQPLVTILWAGVYWLVAGDKFISILLITMIQFSLALVASWLIWRILKLTSKHRNNYIPALAALIWYASPVYAGYTMNGLETGFYALSLLLVSFYALKNDNWSWTYAVFMGILLGISFLVRNDAVFMGMAVYLTYFYFAPEHWWVKLKKVNLMVIIAMLLASPWLIYNYVYFASVIPISSTAQSMVANWGENIPLLLLILLKYSLSIIRIPDQIATQVLWLTIPFILAIISSLVIIYPKLTRLEQKLLILASIYIFSLSIFYGIFFGAGHSLGRYLFPATVFLVILWAILAVKLYNTMSYPIWRYTLAIGIIAIIILFTIRNDILLPRQQAHFQVVAWVQENVSEKQWVAAIQSGTLGYFHDRTINLDGKVNPAALAARQQQQLPEYIIAQQIDYIVDWAGLASWLAADNPRISPAQQQLWQQHYKLLVHDEQRNLAVFARKSD